MIITADNEKRCSSWHFDAEIQYEKITLWIIICVFFLSK